MNPLQQLNRLGQSVWLDYIRRDLIQSGELNGLVNAGEIRGVTSNPTIFEKAISGSDQYREALRAYAVDGRTPEEIFIQLAVEDVQGAADALRNLYEETQGEDGYVSIEVNPALADETEGTLLETQRMWSMVDRPNVMIKIPATEAGIPAIEAALNMGININVTLIFSLDRYIEVMEAYLRGLDARIERGESVDHVASVASFFVSRIDTAVDARLEEIAKKGGLYPTRVKALKGKIAIASAKLAYAQFQATFYGPKYQKYQKHGARYQRPLWASTSTKNPAYPDTMYVDHLIGQHTVNTMPPSTIEAFRDHGRVGLTIEQDLSAARAQIEAVESLGISLADVTQQLERDGVQKFFTSYRSVLDAIQSQMNALG
jgi:transaldolase